MAEARPVGVASTDEAALLGADVDADVDAGALVVLLGPVFLVVGDGPAVRVSVGVAGPGVRRLGWTVAGCGSAGATLASLLIVVPEPPDTGCPVIVSNPVMMSMPTTKAARQVPIAIVQGPFHQGLFDRRLFRWLLFHGGLSHGGGAGPDAVAFGFRMNTVGCSARGGTRAGPRPAAGRAWVRRGRRTVGSAWRFTGFASGRGGSIARVRSRGPLSAGPRTSFVLRAARRVPRRYTSLPTVVTTLASPAPATVPPTPSVDPTNAAVTAASAEAAT